MYVTYICVTLQAGVHSGDSACVIPTQGISEEALATIREWTPKLAKDLRVIGLINIQYCVQDNQVRFSRRHHWPANLNVLELRIPACVLVHNLWKLTH